MTLLLNGRASTGKELIRQGVWNHWRGQLIGFGQAQAHSHEFSEGGWHELSVKREFFGRCWDTVPRRFWTIGPWNGITGILRATLPSSDLAVPQESTQDTVNENSNVAHQVYKL